MKRLSLLLIAVLLVFSLACAGLGGDDEIPEPVEQPVTGDETVEPEDDIMEPEDTPEPEDGGEAPEFAVDTNSLSALDSYRGRMTMIMETGDVNEEMTIEYSFTSDPPAYHVVMQVEGEEMEIIQIVDTQWMRFGDTWTQSTTDESVDPLENFGDILLTSSDFESLEEDGEYEYVGQEEINGISTRHYRLEYESFGAFLGLETGDVEQAIANIWIADSPEFQDFPIRFVMEAEGTFEDEGENVEGKVILTQEFYDINEAFEIEVPEDAETSGLPEGLEIYPEAVDVAQFGGMVTFSTPDDLQTVYDYYLAQLEDTGWTKDEDASMQYEDMVMDSWEKDDQSLSLTLTTNEDSDNIDVMIIVSANEE